MVFFFADWSATIPDHDAQCCVWLQGLPGGQEEGAGRRDSGQCAEIAETLQLRQQPDTSGAVKSDFVAINLYFNLFIFCGINCNVSLNSICNASLLH